jgi:acyl carrier protein
VAKERKMEKISKLIEIVAEACEIEPQEVLRDKKIIEQPYWDSLAAITLSALIDEHFNKTVDSDDYQKADTLQQLLSIIESK